MDTNSVQRKGLYQAILAFYWWGRIRCLCVYTVSVCGCCSQSSHCLHKLCYTLRQHLHPLFLVAILSYI